MAFLSFVVIVVLVYDSCEQLHSYLLFLGELRMVCIVLKMQNVVRYSFRILCRQRILIFSFIRYQNEIYEV